MAIGSRLLDLDRSYWIVPDRFGSAPRGRWATAGCEPALGPGDLRLKSVDVCSNTVRAIENVVQYCFHYIHILI